MADELAWAYKISEDPLIHTSWIVPCSGASPTHEQAGRTRWQEWAASSRFWTFWKPHQQVELVVVTVHETKPGEALHEGHELVESVTGLMQLLDLQHRLQHWASSNI